MKEIGIQIGPGPWDFHLGLGITDSLDLRDGLKVRSVAAKVHLEIYIFFFCYEVVRNPIFLWGRTWLEVSLVPRKSSAKKSSFSNVCVGVSISPRMSVICVTSGKNGRRHFFHGSAAQLGWISSAAFGSARVLSLRPP